MQCLNRFGILMLLSSSPFPATTPVVNNNLGLGLSNSSNVFSNSIISLDSITQPARLTVQQPLPPLPTSHQPSQQPAVIPVTTSSTSTQLPLQSFAATIATAPLLPPAVTTTTAHSSCHCCSDKYTQPLLPQQLQLVLRLHYSHHQHLW